MRHQKQSSWAFFLTLFIVGLLTLLVVFLVPGFGFSQASAQTNGSGTSQTTQVNGAPVPNWDQISFGSLPGIGGSGYFRMPEDVIDQLGYDPSRSWRQGQPPDEIFKLSDLQDYFKPQLFNLEQIQQITGESISTMSLASLSLLEDQTLSELVRSVPELANQTLLSVQPAEALLLQFHPHLYDQWIWDQQWEWDKRWVPPVQKWVWDENLGRSVRETVESGYWEQLDTGKFIQLDTGEWEFDPEKQAQLQNETLGALTQQAEFGNLKLGDLNLEDYSFSTIPGLEITPLQNFRGWEESTVSQVPKLSDVPFSQFPVPPNSTGFGFVALHDVTYGPAEHRRYHTMSGSDVVGFNYPCDEQHGAPDGCAYVEMSAPGWLGLAGDRTMHGQQWIQGGTGQGSQMVPGGLGVLGAVGGGKEPTGRLPFGEVFKVVLTGTDESEALAQFGLYFRVCHRGWIDLGCTPYIIGPIPWLSHHEKDLIFVGQTPGDPPDNIPGMPEIPQEIQDQIDGLTGGSQIDPALGPIDEDCLKKVIAAVPPGDRPAAITTAPYIMAEAQKAGLSTAQTAYVLATVQAESNFHSRDEDGGYCGQYGPGCFYGRGPTQLTWEYNYRYWSNRLNVDLLRNPGLVNDPKIGAHITVQGMKDGTFTGMTANGTLIPGGGQKLSDYINGSKQDFVGARRIVNDGNRSSEIAGNAQRYMKALQGCSTATGGTGEGSGTVSGKFASPAAGRISSGFGSRVHPVTRRVSQHGGIDIGNVVGTPIKAADGGVVKHVVTGCSVGDTNCGGRYGNWIEVDHGNGTTTRYAHLSSVKVRDGMKVSKGQVIGGMGSTGRSTGSHLHFEVRKNGRAVNPVNYLP